MEISNTLVICMGMGTVFVGLISLSFICYITGVLCKLFAKKDAVAENTSSSVQHVSTEPIHNKQEIVAAACAVIAEEVGTDANNIKVVSFKRV